MSKGIQIAVAALAVAVLLGWYASTTLEGGATYRYFQTVEEFAQAGPTDEAVRVHGFVSTGTIERDLAAKAVRFQVQSHPPHASAPPGAAPSGKPAGSAGPGLRVVYGTLEVPDMFKDGAEVVVEGTVSGRGDDATFHATNLLAKCPSKFQAKSESAAAGL